VVAIAARIAEARRGLSEFQLDRGAGAREGAIRKELQERRKMPFLYDIGRETAERLFACIKSQLSA
jgi:hypothetical protein